MAFKNIIYKNDEKSDLNNPDNCDIILLWFRI